MVTIGILVTDVQPVAAIVSVTVIVPGEILPQLTVALFVLPPPVIVPPVIVHK
jgi:hypothetical protein